MKPSPIALPAVVVPERQPLSQETQYLAASMTKNQLDALRTYLTENLPTEAALLAISILGIAVENYETYFVLQKGHEFYDSLNKLNHIPTSLGNTTQEQRGWKLNNWLASFNFVM